MVLREKHSFRELPCFLWIPFLRRCADLSTGTFIVGNKTGAYYRKGVKPMQYILQDCNHCEI